MTGQTNKRIDYIACIQKSIDFIEDNLESQILLRDCAEAAGFSIFHYYRVFGSYVGMPVMEYVRKRKLAHALSDLVKGQRVIDVALDFGFGSERAFSRTFKNEYGYSPGRYRKLIDSSGIPVKLSLEAFKQNNIDGGVVMEPRIIRKPAFKVAGFELKTTNKNGVNRQTIPAFWDKYIKENGRQKLVDNIRPTSPAELGMCFPGDTGVENFSYVIGMEVADFKDVPKEYFKGEVPAATFAVFTTPPANRENGEFVKAIHGTWDYIYQAWFPNSGYEFDGEVKVDFERYDERSAGDEKIQIDIYIPVIKRRA